MEWLPLVSQIVIALGLLNVWLLRARKATAYRGGEAKNMQEEFEAYGLPRWFMILIGFAKVTLALVLIVGIWVPVLTRPAAIGVAALMLGAVAMHIKVADPPKKAAPAFSLLVLCLVVIFS